MWITHSYIGTTQNGTRCLLFLLLEDYVEAQTQFARELDLELERFARNLKDSGAVVRPFPGDIEATRSHILEKNWSRDQSDELGKTPALLMINVDFDQFDPQKHPWFLLNFGERMFEGVPGAYRFREVFRELARVVGDSDVDLFKQAQAVKHAVSASDAARVFEAKPGIFGFSIDLIRAGELLLEVYRKNGRQ
jgi:hypothetical protein